jgi:hypothetical protein
MLTPNQKKIVNQILEDKINDFASFLYENKLNNYKDKNELEEIFYHYQTGYPITIEKKKELINLKDLEKSIETIKNYLFILNKLEKIGAISYNVKDYYKDTIKFGSLDDNSNNSFSINELNTIFSEIRKFKFYKTPELQNFVDRGCLTEEEKELIEKRKERKSSLKWKKWGVIITVFCFIISVLLSFKDDLGCNKNNISNNPQEKLSDTLQLKQDR